MTTTQRFTPAGTNVRDTESHRQLLEMDRHFVGFGSFVRFVDNNENVKSRQPQCNVPRSD